MNNAKTAWLSVAGTLFLLVAGVNLSAQTAPNPSTSAPSQQAQSARAAQNRAAVQNNPACQRIIAECKNLGYIVGQWKKDNGLWKDCFDPVVRGGTPTRDGKSVNVPVSASDVQACRAAQHSR